MSEEVTIENIEGGVEVTFGEKGMTIAQIAKWAWPDGGTGAWVVSMICFRLHQDEFAEFRNLLSAMAMIADDEFAKMEMREAAFAKICEVCDKVWNSDERSQPAE